MPSEPAPYADSCIVCAYSLAGLPIEASCPECGAPVRSTLLGQHLRAADPAYAKRLWAGAVLIRVALIALLSLFLLGTLLLAVGDATLQAALAVAVFSLVALAALAFLVGVFLVTTRDPRDEAFEHNVCARSVARVGLPASFAIGSTVAGLTMSFTLTSGSLLTKLIVFGAALTVLTLAASAACATIYFAGLLRRMGDQRSARKSRVILALITLFAAIATLLLAQVVFRFLPVTLSILLLLGVGLSPFIMAAAFDNLLYPISRALRDIRKAPRPDALASQSQSPVL